MGIIEKQATRNAIYSYIGAALGLFILVLTPRIIKSEENGLLRVLIAIATLVAQFSNLGFTNVTLRLFPYFRNKEKRHNGFLFYAIAVPLLGFSVSLCFFFLFKNEIIEANIEKSMLLVDFIYYLIPLTFFTLFFNVFDSYLRAGYNSVLGPLSKEIIQRISILIFLGLYFFNIIDLASFVFFYTMSIGLPTVILLCYIIIKDEDKIKPNNKLLTRSVRKQILRLSTLTLLSELSATIIVNIDSILLNTVLGLSKTGVYGIAANFGNLMTIPARSINRISSSIVIEKFKSNDLQSIETLYKKTCNNQMAIGSVLFIGILININNIMNLLPYEYQSGKDVIIILSFGYFIEMSTGLNHVILAFSKYYKYDTYFIILLVFIAFFLNYFFINLYGMSGAAIATASTIIFSNLARSIFIYVKYKMQPYDLNSLKIMTISFICLLINYFTPNMNNIFIDGLVRSTIVVFVFIILTFKTEATPDLNNKIRKNLKLLKINI